MRVARLLSGLGRVLMWAGAIVLLFVAHQLWGTNIAEARAQGSLEDEFAALVEAPPDGTSPEPTTSTTRPRASTTTSTTVPAGTLPRPAEGEPVARIEIPTIGVDKIVVEGVTRRDLERGPGHYPETPLPGEPGNVAIAGHRTTYGAPFHRVDELQPGDEILLTTPQGSFRYGVTGTQIVSPAQVEVVADQGDNRLTLTSCHPKYSAAQRIVVSAELLDEPLPEPPPRPDDEAEATPVASLDGDDERSPIAPAVLAGAIAALVWLAFFVLSRRWRRIPAYVLGAPVWGLALFAFFERVALLLPSNF